MPHKQGLEFRSLNLYISQAGVLATCKLITQEAETGFPSKLDSYTKLTISSVNGIESNQEINKSNVRFGNTHTCSGYHQKHLVISLPNTSINGQKRQRSWVKASNVSLHLGT